MKKKNLISIFISVLIAVSPLFFTCMATHAEDDIVSEDNESTYTVILKPGDGKGNDIVIKSTNDGAMAENSYSANPGQFYENNETMFFKTPEMPEEFLSPTYKTDTFKNWSLGENTYYPWQTINLSELSNNTLTLTAQWNDSWFKIKTPDLVEITEPGYTNFSCTLTDLHLGESQEGYQMKVAQDLTVKYKGGSLENNGNNIPYLVQSSETPKSDPEEEAYSPTFTENDIGTNFNISVYISPDDYQNAKPGTYTGNLNCIGTYTYNYYPLLRSGRSSTDSQSEQKVFENANFAVPLTITIPNKETKSENQVKADFSNKKSPKTGDNKNIVPLVIINLISFFGAATAIALSQKERHKTN